MVSDVGAFWEVNELHEGTEKVTNRVLMAERDSRARVRIRTHILDLFNWELFLTTERETKAWLLSRLQEETFESRQTQVQKPQLSSTTFTRKSLRNLYKRFTNLLKAGLQRNTYTQRALCLFRLSTRTKNWMYCTLLWKATSHHRWVGMPAWIWKWLSLWIFN